MSFTMPKNIYCTFDSYCLGVECCINIKLAMFLKVFKFWARFDPCADPMQFVMAFDKYNYTIKITGSLNFDGQLLLFFLFVFFFTNMCLSISVYNLSKKQEVSVSTKYVSLLGFENELKTGIKIDLMGGLEVVVK